MNQETIKWSALEYEEKNRSIDWYWAVGIIALAIAIVAVIYQNYLFAILTVISAFTLLLYAARQPREVQFELSRRGVRVNSVLYPYATLKSFWIHHHDGDRRGKLIVQSEKTLMPYVTIPLPDTPDADTINDFLSLYLPEEEHPESLSEILMERLGF